MVFGVPWPAIGTLGAGVANVVLLWYLWGIRDRQGADKFLLVIGCQVVWCFAYGIGLLTYDPLLREALETVVWVAVSWIGVFYLAFALEYTGRGNVVRSWWFGVVVAFEVISTVVVVTNPVHHLVWAGFAVDPLFGAATVTYAHHAWVFVQYIALGLATSVGVYLLLDTVVSYGPLYRTQAAAVALTPIPPAIAFTVWVFGIGPYSRLNLTAMMFLPHMVLDMYALFRSNMFEFSPSTRRAGERAAIDDLPNPVVIVDERGRVVTLNETAEGVFGVEKHDALTREVGDVVGSSVDPADPDGTVTVRSAGRRYVFKPSASSLTDSAGTHVGYTVVFQDVTEERRREQRLEVLNRVLRHNLRNDLTVVEGNVEIAARRVEDDDVRSLLETALLEVESLASMGQKARQIERTMATGGERAVVSLDDLVEGVVADLAEEFPDATVSTNVSGDLEVETVPNLLRVVVENVVENGLEHAGSAPSVDVSALDREGDRVTLAVSDDGPGIPEHERSVPASGEETDLEHGSGLGLWIAAWGIRSLGGEIRFENDDGATVVLEVPGVVADHTRRETT